ncbi:unnamed protein product [Euphydryas editha]|uniref:UBA domain-containing protein n=1 Tax=Euphydryas editha TaxID=104508 RepID=A0AAU9UVA7_EUPED|nr:unnamed protein product [Euphydryas editha]
MRKIREASNQASRSSSSTVSNTGQTTGQRIVTPGLSNPSLTILPTDRFSETEVEEIVALGFTREQAIVELRRFNGDKTQATVALFAKSLKF